MQLDLDRRKLNNPFYAIQWPLRGLGLLTKPGLRRFILGPLLINLVLYSLAIWLAATYFSQLIARFIPDWLEWLQWLLWPLFVLSLLFIIFLTFTLIANILAAPFYSLLAKKADTLLSGETIAVDDNHSSVMREITSSVASELRRLSYFILRAIPILILFIIPGVNIIAPIVWFLFSAWFLALEYSAYLLDERGLLFPDQRTTLKQFRWGAIAFGGVVMLGLTVPLLNIFVPPAAIVGATAYLLSGQANQ